MTKPTPTQAAIAAPHDELDAMRQDAERYRLLREYWIQIEGHTTVKRALGLDLWCDEQRANLDRSNLQPRLQ